ncbi:hypothetical protein J6590_000757 [Homalodisca vitripennis]|nr:hypothetical protein J6590_092870 [Homalodisca vitripennis]KAG8328100.1 hypothetical protein J6590_000757 [Homalodisca vitripennis]
MDLLAWVKSSGIKRIYMERCQLTGVVFASGQTRRTVRLIGIFCQGLGRLATTLSLHKSHCYWGRTSGRKKCTWLADLHKSLARSYHRPLQRDTTRGASSTRYSKRSDNHAMLIVNRLMGNDHPIYRLGSRYNSGQLIDFYTWVTNAE